MPFGTFLLLVCWKACIWCEHLSPVLFLWYIRGVCRWTWTDWSPQLPPSYLLRERFRSPVLFTLVCRWMLPSLSVCRMIVASFQPSSCIQIPLLKVRLFSVSWRFRISALHDTWWNHPWRTSYLVCRLHSGRLSWLWWYLFWTMRELPCIWLFVGKYLVPNSSFLICISVCFSSKFSVA